MGTTTRPCLISCGVFTKEVETLVRKGDLDLDLHFLSMNLHTDYAILEKVLRAAIEARLADCTAGIVVAYGDVCLGFRDEMKRLVAGYNLVKIDALNCIDCLLGGRGKLLEIDPEHQYLFLNEAFIKFSGKIMQKSTEETRKMFSMLKGIILLDSLGALDEYQGEIDEICHKTGLKILERKDVGVDGLIGVFRDALKRMGDNANLRNGS